MSTKTTFKRVALVAVAALAFGGISAVSSSATDYYVTATADSAGSLSNTDTATGVAGANNFVTLSVDQHATNPTVVVATGGTLVSSSTDVTGSGTASVVVAGGSGTVALKVPTPTVGTITVKSYSVVNGVQTATASSTVTITVGAALAGTVYNHSTTLFGAGSSAPSADVAAADAKSAATYGTSAVARIDVAQYASVDTATAIVNTYAKAVTATISGAGSIDTASAGTARSSSAAVAAAGDGTDSFYVFADGRSGTATIVVSVDGTAVKTYTWNFVGTTKSIKEDADTSPSKTIIGVGETGTLTVLGYDSNGNATGDVSTVDYGLSSNTAVATVAVVNGVATVTGVKAGTATITLCDTASCTSATLSASMTVTIAGTTVKTVALSFDKDTYAPGEKGTLTVTVKDSDGNLIADGARTIYTTVPAPSLSLTGTAPTFTTSTTLASGVKTYTFYAPLTAGTLTFAGTDAADAAISATATVNGGPAEAAAQAALDAAQEATDAANAAYDAANNAMDSADAATAAAQDAADNAAQALTAVTALSATVAKLVKQISAIAATLAKIQKKIGA